MARPRRPQAKFAEIRLLSPFVKQRIPHDTANPATTNRLQVSDFYDGSVPIMMKSDSGAQAGEARRAPGSSTIIFIREYYVQQQQQQSPNTRDDPNPHQPGDTHPATSPTSWGEGLAQLLMLPPNPRSPALLHQDTSYAWSTGFGAPPRSKLSMATMLNKGMGCLHSEQAIYGHDA